MPNIHALRDEVALLAMSELFNVEEDIWSPTYGLKEKLDATAQTTISHSTPKGKLVLRRGSIPTDPSLSTSQAVENLEDRDSPIADAYSSKTSHLTPSQTAFFKKWENLLALEEQDTGRFRKELWTMGAAEREKHGRCFGSMALDLSYTPPSKLPGAICWLWLVGTYSSLHRQMLLLVSTAIYL